MEFKLNIEYNQILKLIHQLPEDKLEKLALTLQTELKAKKTGSKNKMKHLIMNAPTWSNEQLKEYEKARDVINNSRLCLLEAPYW